jgi:hypothetical protein
VLGSALVSILALTACLFARCVRHAGRLGGACCLSGITLVPQSQLPCLGVRWFLGQSLLWAAEQGWRPAPTTPAHDSVWHGTLCRMQSHLMLCLCAGVAYGRQHVWHASVVTMYPLAVSLLVPCASVAGCCWCAGQRPCVHTRAHSLSVCPVCAACWEIGWRMLPVWHHSCPTVPAALFRGQVVLGSVFVVGS